MDNPSYDLAAEMVRETIERVIAESRGDGYHKQIWNPMKGCTQIEVRTMRDCDCIPLQVQAGGYLWRFVIGEYLFSGLIVAKYLTEEAEL